MYKYTQHIQMFTRINGRNIVLGCEDVAEMSRPAPKLPVKYYPATQEDLKALFDKGHPFIVKEAKPKAKPKTIEQDDKAKESDTGDNSGLIEGNDQP